MLVQQLTHVPASDRQAMSEGPRGSATHLRHAAAIPALGQIKIGGTVPLASAEESLDEKRSRKIQPEKPAVVVVPITDSSSAPY